MQADEHRSFNENKGIQPRIARIDADEINSDPCYPRYPRFNSSFPRAGFSFIEILVVISIIVILVSMIFGGMKMWAKSAAEHTTETRLALLNGMLAELDAAGHNQYLAFVNNATANPAIYANTCSTSATWGSTGPAIAYTIQIGTSGSPFNVYTDRQTIINLMASSTIMAKLFSLPNNARALASLPTTAIATAATSASPTSPTTLAYGPQWPPVVLDGWGNPILFVPPAGLINVCSHVSASTTGTTTYVAQQGSTAGAPFTSPDGRPFWVSAGPDGDFVKGDDNIYSFNVH